MLSGMRLMMFGRALAISLALVAFPVGAAEAEKEVVIRDYRFSPAEIEIWAGETVRWVNREKRTSHSVLFPGEKLESERLLPDESWVRTFVVPGEYPYWCGPHPEMKGVVRVLP